MDIWFRCGEDALDGDGVNGSCGSVGVMSCSAVKVNSAACAILVANAKSNVCVSAHRLGIVAFFLAPAVSCPGCSFPTRLRDRDCHLCVCRFAPGTVNG